jgi:anti-anti-sigma factor
MQVKIDTREKFHAITIHEAELAANMTADIDKWLLPILQNGVKNVVLILKDIKKIDNAAAEYLVQLQQQFYEHDASFVICEITTPVEEILDDQDLLELMNIAPTASEAADIVQMEEIERELLDGEDTGQ